MGFEHCSSTRIQKSQFVGVHTGRRKNTAKVGVVWIGLNGLTRIACNRIACRLCRPGKVDQHSVRG